MFVVNIIPLKMYASLKDDYLKVSNQSPVVHHSAMTVGCGWPGQIGLQMKISFQFISLYLYLLTYLFLRVKKIENLVTTEDGMVQLSWVWSGSGNTLTTRLMLVTLQKCSGLQYQLSWVEFSRKSVHTAQSDSSQLVELSQVGQWGQAFMPYVCCDWQRSSVHDGSSGRWRNLLAWSRGRSDWTSSPLLPHRCSQDVSNVP